MEARHRYLSTRLGSATESEEPPPSLSELDRVWWKLDGLTKAHSYRRAELTNLMNQQRGVINSLQARLEELVQARRAESDERLQRSLGAMQPRDHKKPAKLNRNVQLQPNETASAGWGSAAHENSWAKPILEDVHEWTSFAGEVREKREFLINASDFLDKYYKDRLLMLELDFEIIRDQLQFDYERLLRRRTRSAAIPHVVTRHGARAPAAGSGDKALIETARRVYREWYGKLPRVQPLHPYWAAMRHLIRVVDTAAENGAGNVLVVIGSGGVADTVADHLPGLHAQVSLPELLEGNFGKAFHQPIKFDLCICTLEASELPRFRDMAQVVAPYMNRGGKILGFYPNFSLRPLSTEEIALLQKILESGQLHYAGSDKSARVVRRFHATLHADTGGRLAKLVRIAMMLLTITPSALAANRSEAAAPEEQSSRLPKHCTSITIEVTV